MSGRSRRGIRRGDGGDAQAASFSVGWTVPLQTREGAVCTTDYCPAAVSFAAVNAVVAVAWLLSLPLT